MGRHAQRQAIPCSPETKCGDGQRQPHQPDECLKYFAVHRTKPPTKPCGAWLRLTGETPVLHNVKTRSVFRGRVSLRLFSCHFGPPAHVRNSLLVADHDDFASLLDGGTVFGSRATGFAGSGLRVDDFSRPALTDG